jgi:hypothetical protein
MAAGSTYTPLATNTLGSATSSVTFSSIPQGYTDLVLVDNVKSASGAGDSELDVRFIGDSGSNYSTTFLYGNGSSASSGRTSNQSYIYISRTDETAGLGISHFQNYSNNTTYKTVLSRGNSTAYVFAWVGLWRNTNAITSMTLTRNGGLNFATGSTFTLYGIAAA